MTLRARLVAGLVLLLAVVILTFSLVTWFALKSFLVQQVDRQLLDSNPAAALPCTTPPPEARMMVRIVRPAVAFGTALVRADGTPLGSCGQEPITTPLELSPKDAGRLADSVGEPVEVDNDGEEVRALARQITATGDPGSDILVVMSLPLSEVHSTLNRLVILEVLIGITALFGAAGLGGLLVHWGLRPLHSVTRTARAVANEVEQGDARLEHRVDADHPVTEMNQLASAFNTMLESLEKEMSARQRSEDRMRQFLADASHELRTPLTALRGYTELMRMRDGADLTADQDSLARMEVEAQRMSRLVSDLLVLARSDSQTPAPMAHLDLEEVAAQAIESLQMSFPDRSVSLTASGPVTLDGDPDQLQRVFENLLVNAATHTGGAIRLTVRGGDDQVVVTVADDGPGLAPDQAAHVFDRFWRTDTARTRARGGSGLGLAIVSALVGAHGGTVDFDSAPDRGTTVTAVLPVHSMVAVR